MKDILLLLLLVAIAPAQAALPKLNEEISDFCVSYERNDHHDPTEDQLIDAILSNKTNQPGAGDEAERLKNQITNFAIAAGLYSKNFSASVLLNFCGPSAVTLKTSKSVASKIAAHFETVGVRISPHGKEWIDPVPKQIRDLVLAEGNDILTDYAVNLTNEGTTEIRQRFAEWEAREYQVSPGVTRTAAVILQAGDLHVGSRRELGVLERLARKLNERPESTLRERIDQVISRMQPSLGLDIRTLENLKHHVPHLKNVLSEQQQMAEHVSSLSADRKILDARIKIVSDELWIDLVEIRSIDEYNPETYDAIAFNLLRKLDRLEKEFSEQELTDVINRTITIWNWFEERGLHVAEGEARFGPLTRRLFERLGEYQGLDPYAFVLLKALGANAYKARSAPPESRVIKAYADMWKTMPMKPLGKNTNALLPVRHFGDLFNVHGLNDLSVTEGLNFIDHWFERHAIPTVARNEQMGIPLDVHRAELSERRSRYLEQRGLDGCESLLSSWIKKQAKK